MDTLMYIILALALSAFGFLYLRLIYLLIKNSIKSFYRSKKERGLISRAKYLKIREKLGLEEYYIFQDDDVTWDNIINPK